jgi:hypothetical protein
VVDCLVVRQLGDRRQEAVRVAGEEDEVVGVSADRRNLCVGDVLQWVRDASVLRDAGVVVVDLSPVLVCEARVLYDGSELDGVVDEGFVDGVESDALGVGSAFDVGEAGGHPHGLVVSDESAFGVVAQRRLAGARETE